MMSALSSNVLKLNPIIINYNCLLAIVRRDSMIFHVPLLAIGRPSSAEGLAIGQGLCDIESL